MANTRAANILASALITKARTEVGDQTTTPTGDTVTLLKFADTQYFEYLNDFLKEMGTEADLVEGEAITPFDFTYTESATVIGMNLPPELRSVGIIAILDITAGANYGRLCRPILPEEQVDFQQTPYITGFGTNYVYAFTGEGIERNILIKPQGATGRQFRALYIANPLISGLVGDTVIFSDRFARLMTLGTAIPMLGIDGQATKQQINEFERLWLQYSNFVGRYKGPKTIKMVRR